MQGRKALVFAAMLVPCVILAIAAGCKREYPTRPLSLPTYTPTPLVAYTSTITRTPTLTITATPTVTKTRTLTPTMTPTGMLTSTYTLSPTITLTSTSTLTLTTTYTYTFTPTPLPPEIIDDFEDGNSVINAVLGITDPNSWFVTGDTSCTPSFSVAAPAAGNSSLHCGEWSASACATFGSLGFYFSNGITGIYGGTSVDASSATGVRFDIVKVGGTVTSVRFEYMDDYSTSGIAGNQCGSACGPGYGQDLVVGTTWTPVTIFWSACTLPSWYTAAGSTHPSDVYVMYGMHWIANSNGSAFDFQLDNVELIHNPPPPTPTPNCNKIDDMEDGNNRGYVYAAGDCGSTASNVHNGYWYTYHDSLGGTVWPASAEVNFMSAPGANGSNYAMRLTGTNSSGTGDIYGGAGLNLMEPKAFMDLTIGGMYSGIKFDGKVGATATVYRFKLPDVDTDPDGGICGDTGSGGGKCYDDFGQAVTLTSTWTNYSYSFSSMTEVGFGYPASVDTSIPFKPTQTSAVQFQTEEVGVDFDLWIDNITLY